MGEAVETVKGNGSSSSPVPRSKNFAKGSVLADLTNLMDRIDRAKEVKQFDLDQEGRAALAENHAKLGLLQAAGALVRRARALLEDYGSDIDEDISAELNEGLGDDLKALHPDNDCDCPYEDGHSSGHLDGCPAKPKKAADIAAKVFEDAEADAPFGPEDLPEWLKIGAELRDPDEDGPWKVTDLDFEDGRVMLEDQRTNKDGSPFLGGTPLDSITFADLAPEGEWCPYACGHTTTNRDGSCADCGVKDVSVPLMPDIGSEWVNEQGEEWEVYDILGEGNEAKVKLKMLGPRDLVQEVPIHELIEDFEKMVPDSDEIEEDEDDAPTS